MAAADSKKKTVSKKQSPRRRRLGWVVVLGIVLLLVVDQLGVRELSGRDFPVTDPLAEAQRAHVVELAKPAWNGRVPGTEGNAAAARYLEDALKAAGVGPFPSAGGYFVPLPDSRLGHNVLGWIAPDEPQEANAGVIVLGAHFDHLGPTREGVLLGADDNASSVAVLLGALPTLVAMKPRRMGIAVVFFNTEEAYFDTSRQGSRAFFDALPPEIGSPKSIRLSITLDLIGGVVWRQTADSIYACGAEKSRGLAPIVDNVHEDNLRVLRLGIHAVENIPGYRPSAFSDYDVFRDNRVPFLFLSSGRTPRYHHATDLPDTLYYDRMARTSRWIQKLVAEVSNASAPFVYDAAGEDYTADRNSLAWALDVAVKPWTSIPGTSPMTAFQFFRDRLRLAALADPQHVWTPADALTIERASFRMQCLLYRYPICFTL